MTTYWCTSCGAQADPIPSRPSIDPRYVIARCRMEKAPDGKTAREVHAVDSQESAEAIIAGRRAQKRRVLHERHLVAGERVKACADCRELAAAGSAS